MSSSSAELSALNAKLPRFHAINKQVDVTVTDTNKFYTGVTLDIPAKSYFSITASAIYARMGGALWIGIGVNTDVNTCYKNANTGMNHASVSYSGYAESKITLYIFAQWSKASVNPIMLEGFYVEL